MAATDAGPMWVAEVCYRSHPNSINSSMSSRWPAINDLKPAGAGVLEQYHEESSQAQKQSNPAHTTSKVRDALLTSAERMALPTVRSKRPRKIQKGGAPKRTTKSKIEVHRDHENPTSSAVAQRKGNRAAKGPLQPIGRKNEFCLSPAPATKLNARDPPPAQTSCKRKTQDDVEVKQGSKRPRVDERATKSMCNANDSVKETVNQLPIKETKQVGSQRQSIPDLFDEDDEIFSQLLEENGTAESICVSEINTPPSAINNPLDQPPPTIDLTSACQKESSISPPTPSQKTDSSSCPIKPFIRDPTSVIRAAGIQKIPHPAMQQNPITCFRIAEVRRLFATINESSVLVELYASVKRSYRVGQAETLNICFADIFFPGRPPYLESTCRDFATVRHAIDTVETMGDGHGIIKSLIRIRKDATPGRSAQRSMVAEVMSLSKSAWEEVVKTKDLLELCVLEDCVNDV